MNDSRESLKPQRRAAIDVGTNSVKLLVADVCGSSVTPINEDSKQTRLGSGFYETHQLQPDRIAATAAAIARFAALAREMGAQSIRVIATSAARDARNAVELIQAVEQSCSLQLEVISGEKEADWAFHGVSTDPELALLPLLILDVGGGSTEFIVGQNSVQTFRNSYPLGTVRIFERLRLADPPGLTALEECEASLKAYLGEQIAPDLQLALNASSHAWHLIGTGGSATILARMHAKMEDFDRERIEAVRLSLDWIRDQTRCLWQMPLAQRQQIIGLPPKRADVILTGMAIYQQIMEQFDFSGLRVSTRGLRYSALIMEN